MTTPSRLLALAMLSSLALGCPSPATSDGGSGGGSAGGSAGGNSVGGGSAGGDAGGSAGGTAGGVGGGTAGGTGGGTAGGTGGGTAGGTAGGVGGGSAGGAGGGSSGGIAQAQFCNAWATAYCDRESTCHYLDSAQSMTCVARVNASCALYLRQVTAGLYRYDPNVGASCVAATRGYSCNQARGFSTFSGNPTLTFGVGPVECNPLVTITGTAGTPCTSSAQCSAGFYCPPSVSGGCRACAAMPSTGQSCTGGLTCAPGNTCASAGDGGSECRALRGPGETCTALLPCNTATAQACPAGLADGGLVDGGVRACPPKAADGTTCTLASNCSTAYCNSGNRTDAGVRTCGFVANGSPCAATGDCGPTSFCDLLQAFPFVPGTCKSRLPLGTSCTIQRAGDVNDGCADAGNCFDGTCKPRVGTQPVGSQCRSTTLDCVGGASCPGLPADGGYPVCTAQAAAGAPCSFAITCQSGLRCDNVSATCVALSAAGSPCTTNTNCKDVLVCPLRDAGTGSYSCAPLSSPGDDCNVTNVVCASGVDNGAGGFCQRDAGLFSFTGPGQCAAPFAVGQSCGSSAQCASGRCQLDDGGFVASPTPGLCKTSCVP